MYVFILTKWKDRTYLETQSYLILQFGCPVSLWKGNTKITYIFYTIIFYLRTYVAMYIHIRS